MKKYEILEIITRYTIQITERSVCGKSLTELNSEKCGATFINVKSRIARMKGKGP